MIKKNLKANANNNSTEKGYIVNDKHVVFAKNIADAVSMYNQFNKTLNPGDEHYDEKGIWSIRYVPTDDIVDAVLDNA